MPAAIGDILPLAVGIAISPLPVIAGILMVLSPNAKRTGPAFLAGWVIGIVVAVSVFIVIAGALPEPDESGAAPVAGILKLVLGVGMLLLGVREWRGRPAPGRQVAMPKWMATIDSLEPVRAFGLAFLLSAVNPKNLLMNMSAGVLIGSAGLPTGQIALVVAIFTVVAASTVLVPVVGYLVTSAGLAEPLAHLRTWLVDNNAVIMAVLLTVIGTVMIGKGIGSF